MGKTISPYAVTAVALQPLRLPLKVSVVVISVNIREVA